ncbi:hypothetical protein N7522_005433 [Penicillium canescens]|uniref:NAD(P)-binding domain-containing protein n=1 Tax=Penicillium canescens TaxID=5083 RepID=A0AAD6IIK3_PENCN|nr:uncharacterized protein N7446_011055 [Penicillium canescens]KAJ6007082.1 hypothetical protein N7522_005433 [Penicillium canescens]KAJ6029594.1 hypothetical protein N7444_012581 [Penicillium canescens]KAJ6048026.1 hypothetical protein N7460_004173 [Penicillium canescens]KAJ6048372.1 hypothetical protein N7446_011055 [Penicillium canescens]
MSAPLERVAIIGATGRIGGAFAEALVKTGKHTVTALTRTESKGKLPVGVKSVGVNYDDEASIVEALKGQQFLAITLSVTAPDDLHARIAAAAGKAEVPYVMPNVFGYPIEPKGVTEDDWYSQLSLNRIGDVENTNFSSTIKMSCGFWYEWSLALGNQWFGFSIKDRKVTFFDDGKRIITVSTWDQCGRALAGLLSLPESEGPTSVASFKTKEVLISSFRVSQRDMLDSLHRVLRTTDADWEILYEPTAKRVQDGIEEMKNGIFEGFAKMLYGSVFLTSNRFSDYAATMPLVNELLGLPTEDLDEATKRTVHMVESGWNPFPELK